MPRNKGFRKIRRFLTSDRELLKAQKQFVPELTCTATENGTPSSYFCEYFAQGVAGLSLNPEGTCSGSCARKELRW